ncbi:protein of unknown function [Rhodoblastus acidophilus]|uniref:DUF4164 family protein n=1 Tax=Rhodoblastus acidophilus TaxID=1074 RepID=A0A212R4L0_RHOAC|nr:protein of unknown function [Rhodoblastus acidophilus]
MNVSALPIDSPSPHSGPASGAEAHSPVPSAPEPPPSAEDLAAAALRRLETALEALDRAVSRHTDRRMQLSDQEAEYSALQEDRSRLAQALDAANERIDTLQDNQIEAARRVERASAAVRAILATARGES